MTETDLIRNALNALHAGGFWAWRQNSGERPTEYKGKVGRIKLAPAGTPDILVVLPPHGRLLGLEAKTAKGRQRPSQREWQARAERHGAGYAIFRSAGEALAIAKEMRDG